MATMHVDYTFFSFTSKPFEQTAALIWSILQSAFVAWLSMFIIDQIKAKLRAGVFALRDRVDAKSEVWPVFREIVVAESGERLDFVQCRKCSEVLSAGGKTGTSHLRRHSTVCSGASQTAAECSKIDHFSPKDLQVKPNNKPDILNACVMLCTKDMRPFDIVEGAGFHLFTQTVYDFSCQIWKKIEKPGHFALSNYDFATCCSRGRKIAKDVISIDSICNKRKQMCSNYRYVDGRLQEV